MTDTTHYHQATLDQLIAESKVCSGCANDMRNGVEIEYCPFCDIESENSLQNSEE